MFIINQANPRIKFNELKFHKLNSTTLLSVCCFCFQLLIRILTLAEVKKNCQEGFDI
jgi:hypothetical protein